MKKIGLFIGNTNMFGFCFSSRLVLFGLLFVVVAAIAFPAGAQSKFVQTGTASYYSISTNNGTVTASGEPLNDHATTAAHRTLPFGTKVKVTNVRNGKSKVVRITDRGPYVSGRIIDVTRGVAGSLGFINAGLTPVKIEVIGNNGPSVSSNNRPSKTSNNRPSVSKDRPKRKFKLFSRLRERKARRKSR